MMGKSMKEEESSCNNPDLSFNDQAETAALKLFSAELKLLTLSFTKKSSLS